MEIPMRHVADRFAPHPPRSRPLSGRYFNVPFSSISHLDPDPLCYEVIRELAERLVNGITESRNSGIRILCSRKSTDPALRVIEADNVCLDDLTGDHCWLRFQFSPVTYLDPDSLVNEIVGQFPK